MSSPRRTVLKVKEYPNGYIARMFGRTNNRKKNKALRFPEVRKPITLEPMSFPMIDFSWAADKTAEEVSNIICGTTQIGVKK